MTVKETKILYIQSPKISSEIPLIRATDEDSWTYEELVKIYPSQFTINMRPSIFFDPATTKEVYLSFLEFSSKNSLYVNDDGTFEYRYTNIFVNCSLSNSTTLYNGGYSNMIENISVNEERNLHFINHIPIRLDISTSTIGTILSHVEFWLTDDNNSKIDINTQWRCKLLLEIIQD